MTAVTHQMAIGDIGQRRRQVSDRRAQRGVDERPRHRPDERAGGDLPQRHAERTECVRRERIGDAGDEPLTDDRPQSAPLDQLVQAVGALGAEELLVRSSCLRACRSGRR